MNLTFVQIQNAVLDSGFAEIKRADCKNWIIFRHAWIWDVDDWTFVQGTDAVTVTAGSQTVTSLPTDLGPVLGLHRADGTPLEPIEEYRDFATRYVGTNNVQSGQPEAFTVWGGSIFVGPTSNETSSAYLLVYEKLKPTLSADNDPTGLPDGYDLALVHGAKAEGFKLSNVPLSEQFDADFQAAITAMRRKYLVSIRGAGAQVPAYRPGG